MAAPHQFREVRVRGRRPLSHDVEVRVGERQPGGEIGEQGRAAGRVSVGVEEQLAGRAVVDDAVLGIGSGRADVEGIGTQHADRPDPGEERIVEPDEVDASRHVGDGVDVGGGVQRGVEQELVVRRRRR